MAQTIAFIIPRYGTDFAGGAETLVRRLAEALHQAGYPVEVLTTCTNSLENDWNNTYQPGTTTINGVQVHRFPTDIVDTHIYCQLLNKLDRCHKLSYRDEQLFLRTSINSKELYSYLQDNLERYRCCIFAPYMFGTTYYAAQLARGKAIHIPCLHDEDFARFSAFREMLEEARGIIFNTPEEEQLARQLRVVNPFTAVVGSVFDTPQQGNAQRFRLERNLGDDPFLLYTGRFEGYKLESLVDHFLRYKCERSTNLRLILTGHGSFPIPQHDDIINLNFYSGNMDDLRAAALAMVLLSKKESFSLSIMESWQQGRPVIVHRDCPVTYGHTERSGGGWAIASYEEFAQVLDTILTSPELADRRGSAGQRYVAQEYSRETVLHRFHEAIDRFTAPRTLYQELSQRGVRRALEFTSERYEERLRDLIDQALHEADMVNVHIAQAHELYRTAKISRPDYRVTSGLPLIGRLIAWIRVQLTSHLREPYIDPIFQQQEQFNLVLQKQFVELTRRFSRLQGMLDKQFELLAGKARRAQIDELEARIAQLEQQIETLQTALLEFQQREKSRILQED
ncbi:MAG: hypothetical protein KatS3mg057_2662 [Herpetosiphonaceae bacterium]|nr:MAG: hypothetical protein KatS3mg057_2662 [Herpetosiphonaceae bacterium]